VPCTDPTRRLRSADALPDRRKVMLLLGAGASMAGCGSVSMPTTIFNTSSGPVVTSTAQPVLPPDKAARFRNWDDFLLHAGRRLVAANPGGTYTGPVPEPLLAIPVLEVELNGDGSVRRVTVQRTPSQATDTIKLAVDAVYRAAPYGDVSHLPRPWKFSEGFLFRDDRRFKPRVLDL
jgi:hypothetical protein